MANSRIKVAEPSVADKQVDTEQLVVASQTVERERVQIAGALAAEIAAVLNSAPAGTEYALVTRNIPSGTQPVSDAGGAITVDAPVGTPVFVRLSDGAAAQVGQKTMAASLPVVIASDQSTINVAIAAADLFKGRASTFRTPGRAGTVGQKILSLHNATGSPVIVTIKKVVVDLMQTVVKAITVAPPVVRLWKVTVLPTNGTALTKSKIGGSSSSNASVTVLGDASADGTGSGTTLTATLPAGTILTQEFAPRFITAAGYEPADRMEFLGDTEIKLAALEGVVLFLDYVLATQNPTTDMWIASIEWSEI